MRVLITGGAGYIAYNLINTLHDRKDISHIIIYDNLSSSNVNFLFGKHLPKLEFIKGDVLDTQKLESVLSRVDVVYHLAAYVQDAYNYMQSIQYHQVNQWGTLSVARAVQNSSNIRKLVYVSSLAVYGFREGLHKNDKLMPSNAYAKSKFLGEQYVESLCDKCNIHIVRLANVYGYNPCYRKDSVINSFIMDALIDKRVLIYGNGKQKRPFIHIDEAAKHLSGLLDKKLDKETQIVFEFSASVNEIHEILEEQIPGLEYTYINQDMHFESQSFENSELTKEHKSHIAEAFFDFKKNLRVLKK